MNGWCACRAHLDNLVVLGVAANGAETGQHADDVAVHQADGLPKHNRCNGACRVWPHTCLARRDLMSCTRTGQLCLQLGGRARNVAAERVHHMLGAWRASVQGSGAHRHLP